MIQALKNFTTLYYLLLFTLFTINLTGQAEFESGYIINKDGEKIGCLIQNFHWQFNPTIVYYKVDRNSEIQKADSKDVIEFKVENQFVYRSFNVEIDTTSERASELTARTFSNTASKTIFLKEIFTGEINLYKFQTYQYKRFFVEKKNGEIISLLYRKYLTDKGDIAEEIKFKNQLAKNFSCDEKNYHKIRKLKYQEKSIIGYLETYHKCNNFDFIVPKISHQKGHLAVTVKPLIRTSKLHVSNFNFLSSLAWTPSASIGLELEYILPFNRNKWSVISEANYNSYRNKNIDPLIILSTDVTYNSIEWSSGIRYYMHFNRNNSAFVNVIRTFDLNLKSKAKVIVAPFLDANFFELNTGSSIGIGCGYRYLKRYSTEIRYLFPRTLTKDNYAYNLRYETISVHFGYKLF